MISPLNSAGTHVDEREARVAEPRQDVVAERAQAEVRLGQLVAGGRVGRHVDVSGRPLSSQYLRPPLRIRTSRWPYSLSCQYAQAANQLLLSPYRTIVVSGPMPELRQQRAEVLARRRCRDGSRRRAGSSSSSRRRPGCGSARRRSCRRRPRRSGRSGRRGAPAPSRCRRGRPSVAYPLSVMGVPSGDGRAGGSLGGVAAPGSAAGRGRSRRLNSASRSVQEAAARWAWRTIHGSTRLESSMVRVGPTARPRRRCRSCCGSRPSSSPGAGARRRRRPGRGTASRGTWR